MPFSPKMQVINIISELTLSSWDACRLLSSCSLPVYNAIGQASFDLYDDIDFDSWFRAQLLAELQIKENQWALSLVFNFNAVLGCAMFFLYSYRIIRRRVIWLIGHWVGVKLSTDLRPVLYESILPLLQPSEDLVVRMEAAGTLKVDILWKYSSSSNQFTEWSVHFDHSWLSALLALTLVHLLMILNSNSSSFFQWVPPCEESHSSFTGRVN